jgi:PilZ domain
MSRFSFWPVNERRSSPRWRVAMNVIYGVGDDMTATTSVDISEYAISVFARNPSPVGSIIEVHLATNRNERWIKVKGKVLRAGGGVMAVEFVNFSKKDMAELGDYLRQLHAEGRSELIAI